jgi:hypothetical protein
MDGDEMHVRRIRSRNYGDYYQLVRSHREGGTVKKEVLVHLGEHATPGAALVAWPEEIDEHRRAGRDEQADKLQGKLKRLEELTG